MGYTPTELVMGVFNTCVATYAVEGIIDLKHWHMGVAVIDYPELEEQ